MKRLFKSKNIEKPRQAPAKYVKLPKTKNPWLLETVENGLRATNIKETQDSIRADKAIPVQYFEYDRLFGGGVFETPLRVIEMFDELKDITPQTIGYIFSDHKYLYISGGILRRNHITGNESFFSDETLRNQSIACYLSLEYAKEESTILETIQNSINELDNAGHETDTDRARIQDQDSE